MREAAAMRTGSRLLRALGAVLLVTPLLGCPAAVVAVGAGAGFVWYNGQLQETVAKPLPEVEKAAEGALRELELSGIASTADKLKAEVSGRMADGTKVTVHLKAVSFDATEVTIRVGTVGDRAVSLQILRHIERRLGIENG